MQKRGRDARGCRAGAAELEDGATFLALVIHQICKRECPSAMCTKSSRSMAKGYPWPARCMRSIKPTRSLASLLPFNVRRSIPSNHAASPRTPSAHDSYRRIRPANAQPLSPLVPPIDRPTALPLPHLLLL
jgi:hypothetical protein